MRTISTLCALVAMATIGHCDVICYEDLDGRCFTNDPPFDNTNQLPDEPSSINTKFTLYTSSNRNTGQVLNRHDPAGLAASNFDNTQDSKFIIHGWLNWGDIFWMHNMKDAYLDFQDGVNVFLVDWQGGAQALYGKSVANTRVVGAEADLFAKFLIAEADYTPGQMHCVGHSLGGQTCGYFGEGLPFLGRITGLDPAGPSFEGEHELVRLDPRDAQQVDVIHSDAESLIPSRGLGIWQECGHIDFYPNGGIDQPGCDRLGNEVCDHIRAAEYHLDSISPTCKFTSHLCELDNWSNCDYDTVNYMGEAAQRTPEGVFYLETLDDSPYCMG
ncbi:pancreatic triacylglycerol lipase-like [Glandiceps talaboti]